MASSKKIGLYCGEEKLTLVELEKNTSLQVVSASMGTKTDSSLPFSSSLTEEIQVTALLGKILQDYKIKGVDFCISLPMKDIILRSFVIPRVSGSELQNVIKFEAKKYMPFEIQDLSFVFHTVPFTENQVRHIQVIFMAVRKDVLERYERIFEQLKINILFCDPCQISLVKALLFKKEIKPTDHVAFLYLDKDSGYVCFINQCIPQFVRDFQINASGALGQANDGDESMNVKIINEVGNSFDFYARQFNVDKIENMIVSSSYDRQELFDTLATELKVKIRNFSPLVTTVGTDQINHMDAIYALGVAVDVPLSTLSNFHFYKDKSAHPKSRNLVGSGLDEYKNVILTAVVCLVLLVGLFVFFQTESKSIQIKYDALAAGQGEFLNNPVDGIQAQIQGNTEKLAAYKDINVKSDIASILLRLASLLPQGVWLQDLNIIYGGNSVASIHVTITMTGYVFKDDPNEQISLVNDLVLSFRSDPVLSKLVHSINLGSITRSRIDNRDVTTFVIHCT